MASLAQAKQEAKQETLAADAAASQSQIALQDRVTLFATYYLHSLSTTYYLLPAASYLLLNLALQDRVTLFTEEEPPLCLTATPRLPPAGSATVSVIQDRVWLHPKIEIREESQDGAPSAGHRQDGATVAAMAASARAAARVAAAKAAATAAAEAPGEGNPRSQTNVSPQLARARAHRRRSEGGIGVITSEPRRRSEGGGSPQSARAGVDRRRSEGSADPGEPSHSPSRRVPSGESSPPSPSPPSLLRRRSSGDGSSMDLMARAPRPPLSPPPSPPAQPPAEASAPNEDYRYCYLQLCLPPTHTTAYVCFTAHHSYYCMITTYYYSQPPITTLLTRRSTRRAISPGIWRISTISPGGRSSEAGDPPRRDLPGREISQARRSTISQARRSSGPPHRALAPPRRAGLQRRRALAPPWYHRALALAQRRSLTPSHC